MTVTESRSADRKKVRFPPPKAWGPEAKWTQDCVMFRVCGEKHPPGKCDAFKTPTAEVEGDRQQGALSALLPAPARAGLLVEGQGAQLRRRRL